MECNLCIHKTVCHYKRAVDNFAIDNKMTNILSLNISDCVLGSNILVSSNNNNSMFQSKVVNLKQEEIPHDIMQIDKNEEFIKDFSKRDALIKKSYRDASGAEVVCPSCKEKTTYLSKCMDCGKPVCPSCGEIVSTGAKESGMMCKECLEESTKADDAAQQETILLDGSDNSFLRTVVRHDIPDSN